MTILFYLGSEPYEAPEGGEVDFLFEGSYTPPEGGDVDFLFD